mgnify:CR=1 FL=1
MKYKGAAILIAAINIQARWRARRYKNRHLSAYPLDLSDHNSSDYRLYLEYKGIVTPSDKTISAFKQANVQLPRLKKHKSSDNLLFDFVSSVYGDI